MSRHPLFWLFLLTLLSVAACKRDASGVAAPAAAKPVAINAVAAPPSAPTELPASWPTGDAITLALTPDAGATSLTKALYERGDIVLEQIWPDGKRERWWHAADGTTRHVSWDGSEQLEAAP